jgi:uncharacterized protein
MKNKFNLLYLLLVVSFATFAQQKSISPVADIKNWQKELNDDYKNVAKSPLKPEDLKTFKGHTFFEIDTSYRVVAHIILTKNVVEIPFNTSTLSVQIFIKYADLEFMLKGVKYQLPIYQSKNLMKIPTYANYLFLPFIDETSGKETYGAGRYIDLQIPQTGNTILLDFNKAYNPYCAYATGFSCPKVPEQNILKTTILAGVRYNPTH